jgi:hypothetical protein
MIKLSIVLLLSYSAAFAKPQLNKSFRPWWNESLFYYDTYHSIGNFNATGNPESLPSSNSFWEKTSFEYANRYVYNRTWAMTASINHVQAQSSIATNTKFNGGFQTLKGGVEYKLDSEVADFILEGVGHWSLFAVDPNSIKPVYGDGSHALGGNFCFQKRISSLFWGGKLGFLYRTEGLSSLVPYQLGLGLRFGNLHLSGTIDGSISVGQDQETTANRHNFLNRTNAGSLHYRSANPNSNSVDFQAKWNVTNQFGFIGGVGNNFLGKNSSDGAHYFVGLDVRWQVYQQPTESNPLKNAVSKPPKPIQKEEKSPLYYEEDFTRDLEEGEADSL